MKRRTFAEAESDGEIPASSSSEDCDKKRPRTMVAASGFDQRGPTPGQFLVAAGSARLGSVVEVHKVRRTLDVPLTVDQNFMQRLFGPKSKFSSRIREETGCMAVVLQTDSAELSRPSLVVHIGGKTVGAVESAVARIRGLFRLTPSAWSGLVSQFAQRTDAPTAGLPSHLETKHLDLTNLDMGPDKSEKLVNLHEAQVPYVMTVQSKQAITQSTGATIEWEPPRARLIGTSLQISKAEKLLLRVTKHCYWGASAEKVASLLRPAQMLQGSARLRLSPMSSLMSYEVALSSMRRCIKIGKGTENDIVVSDALVSRSHCVLEFDRHRGGIYVYDLSTNGTFLNGKRLPNRKHGKVILMHGDELLLKNPEHGDEEFGYIINLQWVY